MALVPAPLTVRTSDSQNAEDGVFGAGWTSAYDARATEYLGTGGGSQKASLIRQVYLTTEDNRVLTFESTAGGSFVQSWPPSDAPNRMIDIGTGYALELNGDPYVRYYRGSDGRLEKLTEIVGGREYTIVYDGATGMPTEVVDSIGGPIATFLNVDGLVREIAVGGETVTYEYGDDTTLDMVAAASQPWRSYSYSAERQLTEAADGSGRLIQGFGYTDGWATSSTSASKSINSVGWGGTGPRSPAVGEKMVRTDSAEGASTYYFLQQVAGKERVVEVVGECACSGNDRIYAYDALGNVVLEQDGRGYITRRDFLGDGRVLQQESGLHTAGCDPADFPEDPTACRLTVDELRLINPENLVSGAASNAQWYAYEDPAWPTRPTQVCRQSVLQLDGESDRVTCRSIFYHQASGQWATIAETGWTGVSPEDAVFETRTTIRTFYSAAVTLPVFEPGGAFDPSWLAEPQPVDMVRSSDGPREDVNDIRKYVYYPEVETVPADWRGRLAAEMDPLGFVTRYEDYDEWGNARRIVGPTGVVTERSFDRYGRVLTSTLVAGAGCDPVDDPLCSENLVTNTTYEPGGGPLATVTSPGGAVTEYAYDDFGRVLTTDRGPGPGDMRERLENEYDPVTGLKIRDSRLAREAGWVERSRTEYDHYLNGQLVLVERPRFDNDQDPSAEHYTYDVAGRIETVQDPNHTAPNVQYEYDDLGRLETVWQVLDADAAVWIETAYAYDSDGNLIAVTDAEGNTTKYVVDDFGQTVRIDSPVTGITDMTYDPADNLVTRSDGRGVMSINTFDAGGRLVSVVYDDGVTSEELSYEYDGAGRRTLAVSADVEQNFTHSRRGLVLTARQTVDGTTHETRYSYDLDGQLERVTYPSGREVTFETDYAGRPNTITSVPPGGGSPVVVADNLEYLPFGPASHLELGPVAGRVIEERGHDWQYRRSAQTAVGPGATGLLDLEYDYDAAGNLITRTDHLGDRGAGYGYDDLSRLTGASWADAKRVYEYDTIGNLERLGVDEGLTGEGEVVFGYAANPAGGNSAVLESTETRQGGSPLSSYVVESDDIGNVTSDGLTTFDYDAQNHLGSRALKGVTIENTYSADGRLARSTRSDTGAATDIVLEAAGRRLAKLEGGAWRDYVYLGDQLLAYFDDGEAEPTQVLADHIGMPMMAVDSSGTVVRQALSEPYGELRGEVGLSADPGLRYPGQWQDELDLEGDCVGVDCNMPGPLEDSYSLFENGYRWYVPRWGRYGQADPLGRETGEHLYGYAISNPFGRIDPSGLQSAGVDVCVRPFTVFPRGMSWWNSPVNHAYLQIGSWTAGFQADDIVHIPEDDPTHPGRKCWSADRAETGSLLDGTDCRCATDDQIQTCVKNRAIQGSKPGGFSSYNFFFSNCGDWAQNTLKNCCLSARIPGHWYLPYVPW
jgi:RHS repeat-associated protein